MQGTHQPVRKIIFLFQELLGLCPAAKSRHIFYPLFHLMVRSELELLSIRVPFRLNLDFQRWR